MRFSDLKFTVSLLQHKNFYSSSYFLCILFHFEETLTDRSVHERQPFLTCCSKAEQTPTLPDILKGTSNNDVFGARLDRCFRPTSASNA